VLILTGALPLMVAGGGQAADDGGPVARKSPTSSRVAAAGPIVGGLNLEAGFARSTVDLAGEAARGESATMSAGAAEPETEALGGLLRRLRDRTGCAMVIVAHDVPLLLSIADRLVAMDLGRVIADGLPADVVRHPAVVSSYLGAAADRAMISQQRRH
jgi:hypothetical protein